MMWTWSTSPVPRLAVYRNAGEGGYRPRRSVLLPSRTDGGYVDDGARSQSLRLRLSSTSEQRVRSLTVGYAASRLPGRGYSALRVRRSHPDCECQDLACTTQGRPA